MCSCFVDPETTAETSTSADTHGETGSSTSPPTSASVTSSDMSGSSADVSTFASESDSGQSDGGSTGQSDCVPAPSGIVAWWRAEDGFLDSVGSNHGVPVGGASTSRAGFVGAGLAFDGIDDAVLVGNGEALQLGLDGFSLEAWVRLDASEAPDETTSSTPGDLTIAAKMIPGDDANADGWRLFKQQQDEFWFCFGSALNGCGDAQSTTVRTTPGTPVPGEWIHLAAVQDGAEIRIYLAGELADSRVMEDPVVTDTASLYLGAATSEPGDPMVSSLFYGSIDEVALYDRPLSPEEILELATTAAGKCAG
jgi:Concanavalin A-like lectin/glucanases superfamily